MLVFIWVFILKPWSICQCLYNWFLPFVKPAELLSLFFVSMFMYFGNSRAEVSSQSEKEITFGFLPIILFYWNAVSLLLIPNARHWTNIADTKFRLYWHMPFVSKCFSLFLCLPWQGSISYKLLTSFVSPRKHSSVWALASTSLHHKAATSTQHQNELLTHFWQSCTVQQALHSTRDLRWLPDDRRQSVCQIS